MRHPENGHFQDMNACVQGLERSFYRYCASESIELIAADTPSKRSPPRKHAEVERYISEMTASLLTTRFEIIPTPWALHPDSGVDELMEEDDDVLVDSSQGEGAAPVIPEEPIDEDGQPEEELEESSHPDQVFHNTVKAKARDALNMLSTGSIEIDERTGTLCVLCGSDQHSFPICNTDSPALRQGLAWFKIMEEAIEFYPKQLILESSQTHGPHQQRQAQASGSMDVD